MVDGVGRGYCCSVLITPFCQGRQILALEATRLIMASPPALENATPDPYGRVPFQHQALAFVDKIGLQQPQGVYTVDKIANLATTLGTRFIMRWKPRMVSIDGLTPFWTLDADSRLSPETWTRRV